MFETLGVRRVRLLTSSPHKVPAQQRAPIEVVARVAHEFGRCNENRDYLVTKKRRLWYLLTGE